MRTAIAVLLLVATSLAQASHKRTTEAWVDPYTGGDAARVAAAGYVGYGPFAIDDDHGSRDIDRLLGATSLLWLETAHFKLGLRLPEYRIPTANRTERDKLRAELSDLRQRMPDVDVATRSLDPWLRLHLTALRLEGAYAAFEKLVEPVDPASATASSQADLEGGGRGVGAWLGKDDKFVVLVFATRSDLARYAVDHLGRALQTPQREDLGALQGMLFVTALDCDPDLTGDTGLHCHLVYAVVENMVAAYRGHRFDLPAWIESGLAQSFALAIDPQHPNFDRGRLRSIDPRPRGDLSLRVRSLVEKRLAAPFSQIAGQRDVARFTLDDFVFAWSRITWLRSLGDDRFAHFMALMKAPLPTNLSRSVQDLVIERQATALREAFGITGCEDLDRKWTAWVLARRS
ncbi:MAG: hypothetical protein U1F36_10190 [Planctomycetota bacterium]